MSDRDWLNDMQTVVHNLRAHASTFRSLAGRLCDAEMDRAAGIATQAAEDADEDSEMLSRAISNKVTGDLKDSAETTCLLFRAALNAVMVSEDPAGGGR